MGVVNGVGFVLFAVCFMFVFIFRRSNSHRAQQGQIAPSPLASVGSAFTHSLRSSLSGRSALVKVNT